MRTTVNLDDALLRAAKSHAAATGRTLTAVITDALRRELSRSDAPAGSVRELPTFSGRGTLPGVDLANSAALLELMDGR